MKLSPGRALLTLLAATALACSSEDQGDAARTLSRIDVSPASPWLVAPTSKQFYATAVYSDGFAMDVTAQATWTSSAPATLTFDAASGGLAEVLAAGGAAVSAAWEGVSGSTTVTVVAADDPSVVTFAGNVTYEFVPARYDAVTRTGTLDFAATEVKPVRGALVRVMQGTTVLAETTTGALGGYAISFAGAGAGGTVSLVALAMTKSPPIQVEDNTDGNAVWAVGKTVAATSDTHSLHATHGWETASGTYDPETRIAAPFAILDAMVTAAQGFAGAGRSPIFPTLRVNWSPDNTAAAGSDGWPDVAAGFIVTSHYSWDGEIYILGKEADDTDEFDAHVVVHEWGHYFEDRLSRADSPGGAHGIGDVLDPRLAFGEGYGSALAAMLLPRTVYGIYADTYWDGGGLDAFGFDAETAFHTDDCVLVGNQCLPGQNPGPFSEMSIIRLLYDLWDSGTNEAWDGVALGLGPIYDVLVGPQKATPALTTIASFIAGLKAQPGVDAERVDDLLAYYSIGPIADEWGTGDTDLEAMYVRVPVPSTTTVTLDGRYLWNMQPQNRYLVFTATGTTTRVTSTSSYDVDLYAFGTGTLLDSDESADGKETLQFATTPGAVYVVVVTGWGVVNGPYSANVTVSTP